MVLEMIKIRLNLSTGEFQSLTGQLDDVNCLMMVIDKLVSLQVSANVFFFQFQLQKGSLNVIISCLISKPKHFFMLKIFFSCLTQLINSFSDGKTIADNIL